MERITISLDPELLADLDRHMDRRRYTNRSEAIRDILRDRLATERLTGDDAAPCTACVTYVYNHRERSLAGRLVETQHSHHDLPKATLHIHLSADACLEATVLEGPAGEVRRLADHLIAQPGVRHGHVHVVPAPNDKKP